MVTVFIAQLVVVFEINILYYNPDFGLRFVKLQSQYRKKIKRLSIILNFVIL